VQFYLLGPNIENIPLSQLEARSECLFIVERYKTVASESHRVDADPGLEFERLAELCKKLDGPTMIYCRSPKRAADIANNLVSLGVKKSSSLPSGTVEWLEQNYHRQWHFT
jgi:rhodanese-related sulfurtransferase